jgi:coenzyme F420-0:L-glutamate ligase/coenzyme F420-1:gamma-L-glutamate ligase
VHVAGAEAKEALADAMADAWLAELRAEGAPVQQIAPRLERSRREITGAPLLLLACLVLTAARQWPDERRRRAERDMFVQSLGAALQNILLAASERGLAGYLKGAPLFCPEAVRSVLGLPEDWEPAFLVLLGYPEPGAEPPPRPPLQIDEFLRTV